MSRTYVLTANWALGELLSIPGPTGCIVTYCRALLNVLCVYAERFFIFYFFFIFFILFIYFFFFLLLLLLVIEVFSVWLIGTWESCLAYPAYQMHPELHSNIVY